MTNINELEKRLEAISPKPGARTEEEEREYWDQIAAAFTEEEATKFNRAMRVYESKPRESWTEQERDQILDALKLLEKAEQKAKP